MAKLQKKHDAEKQSALQEFQAFKEKMSSRESRVTREFQGKVDALREEIDKMNSKFQEKIAGFTSSNQDLQKALDQANSSGSRGIEETRKKHGAEIAELVKAANEKYQLMLIEQLQIQENVKKEFEKSLAAAKNEALEKHKADLEQQIGQIRAELNGDKQEALMALKRDMEEKLQAQRQELTGKLEKLLTDLKLKSDECETLREERDRISKELNQRITDLQRSMGDHIGGHEEQMKSLTTDLLQSRDECARLRAQVTEREEEISRLQKLLSSKNDSIVEMETSLGAYEREIARLTHELERSCQSGASLEADLKSKLTIAEHEVTSLRAEVNSMASNLASARDELKALQKSSMKAAQDFEKTIATLTAEKDALHSKLSAAAQAASSSNQMMAQEAAALRQQLKQMQEAFDLDKAALIEAHRRAMEALAEQHRVDAAAADAARLALQDTSSLREAQMKADMEALRAEFVSKMESMLATHEKLIADLTAANAVEVTQLNKTIETLESQLHALSEQADGEKGARLTCFLLRPAYHPSYPNLNSNK